MNFVNLFLFRVMPYPFDGKEVVDLLLKNNLLSYLYSIQLMTFISKKNFFRRIATILFFGGICGTLP